jgi:hypothetical protein
MVALALVTVAALYLFVERIQPMFRPAPANNTP